MGPVSATPLRRWLRRHPQPARLRVDARDVAVASGANQWAVTEESVLALNPSRVEALDANGVMLRATVLDGSADADDAKPVAAAPESELAMLARLIGEAHDAGARRHAEAYALAFAENTRLVQILANRLGSLETSWQKAMQHAANAQAQAVIAVSEAQAAQSADPSDVAVHAMLAQAIGGAVSAPRNGVAKKEGTKP